MYSRRPIYAVVGPGNQVLAVEEDERAAVRAGARYGTPVIDETLEVEAFTPNPLGVQGPDLAWDRVGNLYIDLDHSMRLSLEEAHARLLPFFPEKRGKPVKQWSTPRKMAQGLLGQNDKTEKTELSAEERAALLSRYPEAKGIHVVGLSLLPNVVWARAAGVGGINTCVGASKECIAACLVYAGQNESDPYNAKLKFAKTNALFQDPQAMGRMLFEACHRQAESRSKDVRMVRLNVFSDIPWERVFPEMFQELSGLQFYDYTKVPFRDTPSNYDLTFSYSGRNLEDVMAEIDRGRRAAVVFLTDKHRLPSSFLGLPVVDGDLSDARPLDPTSAIVGLAYKPPLKSEQQAKAHAEENVFIVPVQEVDGALVAAIVPRQQPGVEENLGDDATPPGAVVPGDQNVEFLEEADLIPESRLVANPKTTRKLKAKLLR